MHDVSLRVSVDEFGDTLRTVGVDDATGNPIQFAVVSGSYSEQSNLLASASDSLGYRLVKRTFDILVASLAILILSPLMLIVAFCIWFEDRGPIFYKQKRLGRNQQLIDFYKFRSMSQDADRVREHLLHQSDAEGKAFKMKNDPRVTRIGKFIRRFSIDELPQLFLVLTGVMSVIGPRPLIPSEGLDCDPWHQCRYVVKPGLLCFREVQGRSKLSFDQWMDLDVEYVERRSLWTDMQILARVIPAVLGGEGAY